MYKKLLLIYFLFLCSRYSFKVSANNDGNKVVGEDEAASNNQIDTNNNNNNNKQSLNGGNIRIELMDGDMSHLFKEEDFEKVEAKLLYKNVKKRSFEELGVKSESVIESEQQINEQQSIDVAATTAGGGGGDLDHILNDDESEGEKLDNEPLYKLESVINELNKPNDDLNDTTSTTISVNKTRTLGECTISKDRVNQTQENSVRLVNGSALTTAISESTATECFVVMFYVSWCPFSANLAPYFNALPRAFKYLDILAFDVSKSTGYNTKFGTTAVPMVLIFQHKNVIGKYNHTQRNLSDLIEFVSKTTGLTGNQSIVQIESDYEGPVPTVPIKKFDYALLISWLFIIFFVISFLIRKLKIIELIRGLLAVNVIQHVHND